MHQLACPHGTVSLRILDLRMSHPVTVTSPERWSLSDGCWCSLDTNGAARHGGCRLSDTRVLSPPIPRVQAKEWRRAARVWTYSIREAADKGNLGRHRGSSFDARGLCLCCDASLEHTISYTYRQRPGCTWCCGAPPRRHRRSSPVWEGPRQRLSGVGTLEDRPTDEHLGI